MTDRMRRLALTLLVAAGLAPATAQAQQYGARTAPLYPDQLPPGQAYAVEVAPGVYAFHRPAPRDDRYARRRPTEERAGGIIINTEKVVHDPPLVIEHRHVVDDPPRIIERRRYVEDAPQAGMPAPGALTDTLAHGRDRVGQVIRADAEITILGPDRMIIRIVRKRGADANARAQRR